MSLDRIITVTKPATSIDLTTLQTVKSELEINGKEDDERIQRWITDSSSRIATFLGRPLGEAGYQESFWLDRFEKFLKLSRYPILALTSVTDTDGTALISGTDFIADLELGMLYRMSTGTIRTHWARGNIVVQYTAGYSLLETLPRQVEEACLILVKHRWHARDRDPMLTSEEVAGIERSTFWVGGTGTDSGMPPEAEDLLRPLREVRT